MTGEPKKPRPQNPPTGAPAGWAKAIVLISMILFSASVSVFTFLAITRIEGWLAEQRAGAGAKSRTVNETAASADTVAWYDYTPAAEINYANLSSDIVKEDPPHISIISAQIQAPAQTPQQSDQTAARPSQTFRPTYTAARPFSPQSLQNTTQNSPRSPAGIPFMIDNASTDISYYALTFDGGSIANAAADIFDTLASRGVKSTMFVTGEFIRKYPHVVTKAAQNGHEIGNHTHRHPRLTTYAENQTQSTRPEVTRQFLINELDGAARILADRTGLRFAPLWRAPYGEYNPRICGWALEAGYIHIGWRQGGSWSRNLDTNDWVPTPASPAYKTPQEVYDKITHIASQPGGLNGGIILMHLGTERKQRDQQVHIILGRLIDTLREMGYEPLTVSNLLQKSGVNVNAVSLLNDSGTE
ncbi:MAG: polysaccharide deacetylase family protein [Chitinispirillia bacterium]|nr:polysaccharide deacetylase family protein [Chitinispirillia bacterium]MCL2269093.1 polysaccharide deacetylase family protein [Chitinispirillia bacterium]